MPIMKDSEKVKYQLYLTFPSSFQLKLYKKKKL